MSKPTNVDWVKLNQEMQSGFPETNTEKFVKRFVHNPFVPIGAATTCYVLYRGLRSFGKRDSQNQQKMMRRRVQAQFFTIFAAVASILLFPPEEKQVKDT